MSTICLNMIVKNESHIIEKTLENIYQKFPISYWVISDTGSTDNTVEIIKNFLMRKVFKVISIMSFGKILVLTVIKPLNIV